MPRIWFAHVLVNGQGRDVWSRFSIKAVFDPNTYLWSTITGLTFHGEVFKRSISLLLGVAFALVAAGHRPLEVPVDRAIRVDDESPGRPPGFPRSLFHV